jgi:two-component system, OmpR family, response regulator
MHKVLIVEDSADIAQLIQIQLTDINCQADIAIDGQVGLDLFNKKHYDIIILDLMLPVLDGMEVCKAIRNVDPCIPILILTSKSSELDRIIGLELGADDYLTKPFSMLELLARIKALFRRISALEAKQTLNNSLSTTQIITLGQLSIDENKREVLINNKLIELTSREFSLLLYFAQHPGQVYSRVQLLDAVWGYSHDGYEHTVNSHINRLRAKIEIAPADPKYILTVWGVGYKFNHNLDVKS